LVYPIAQTRKNSGKDVEKLERIYQSRGEVREMLITALEKEKKELYKRAKREGGIEKQIEIARKMLIDGFDLPVIANLTGLSQNELLKLKQKMSN
jgi:predicted transposase/invertase (TIGR01784 family)